MKDAAGWLWQAGTPNRGFREFHLKNIGGVFPGGLFITVNFPNNSANIGMTSHEMAGLWNEKNPDNPIVLEPAPEVSLRAERSECKAIPS